MERDFLIEDDIYIVDWKNNFKVGYSFLLTSVTCTYIKQF